MIDPVVAVFLALAMMSAGALGRSPLRSGGQLGADGSHGTTMTLGTVDSVEPALTEELITYTFTVTNTGSVALVNLSLAITYDSDSTYVSSSAGTFTTIGESAGVVTATKASVAAGGTAICTVTVRTPTTGQTLSLSASATADNATTQNDTETTVVKLVSRDATSLKYVPANATEWSNFSDAVGFACAPSLLWLCQEASGNLADSIGSFTGTAVAGAISYQQSESGWTRKGVEIGDNSISQFYNTDAGLPDPASASCLILQYTDLVGAHAAADMIFMEYGNPGPAQAASFYRKASNSVVRMQHGINNSPDSSGNRGGQVRPYVLQADITHSFGCGYTDEDKLPATVDMLGTKIISLGSGLSPGMRCLYYAAFFNANAELTTTQIKTMLQRLGWTVTWTP